jgi:hypothetical protein
MSADEQDCHYQGVNRLRTLLDRWFGRNKPMDHETPLAEKLAANRVERQEMAQDSAEFQWWQARRGERERRHLRRHDRRAGTAFLPPPMSEMAFVNQITSRKRTRREEAAAMLQGRRLSGEAALVLVWQLRHRDADYRMSALQALRGSTISSETAGRALAAQLEDPEPELREVAEQVLREAILTDDAMRDIRGDLR